MSSKKTAKVEQIDKKVFLNRLLGNQKTSWVDDDGKTIHMYVVTITPQMAREIISHCNVSNRKISNHRVEQYALDMKSGLWNMNTDVISFSDDGRLANGQHRLLGVIRSGKSIRFTIHWGGDYNKLMATLDDGLRRTAAQELTRFGKKFSAETANAIKYLHKYSMLCSGKAILDRPIVQKNYSKARLLRFYDMLFPEIMSSEDICVAAKSYNGLSNGGVRIALHLLTRFDGGNTPKFEKFWKEVQNIERPEGGDALVGLDNAIRRQLKGEGKGGMGGMVVRSGGLGAFGFICFLLTIKAWEKFKKGENWKRVHFPISFDNAKNVVEVVDILPSVLRNNKEWMSE